MRERERSLSVFLFPDGFR